MKSSSSSLPPSYLKEIFARRTGFNRDLTWADFSFEVKCMELDAAADPPALKALLDAGQYAFHHPTFDRIHAQLADEIRLLSMTDAEDREDSVIQCPQCHGWKVATESKQTRSSDESATVFASCASCAAKWRVN